VNFLKLWKNWNNITRAQKALIIAADSVYILTFAALIILALMAVININDNETFGVIAAIFLGVFFVAISIDVIFNTLIIRNISSGKDYKEILKLLESDIIPDGDKYFYFNRNFRDNIIYGNLQASEEDYRRALDTINLPERPLSGDENYLSDSDKKKAVLARMLLSNPEELDINEILTHCDSVTKLKIYHNIKINYPEINIK
jgi:ABC-type transport system involved in cytochrome bd biosynthesis fused ATPase/permease subunit